MTDFDAITRILNQHVVDLFATVKAEAEAVADLTDKEVGLRLATFPKEVQRFIFPYRKFGGELLSGRTRDLAFRAIRPDGNVLDGYAPSSSVSRVMNEAA